MDGRAGSNPEGAGLPRLFSPPHGPANPHESGLQCGIDLIEIPRIKEAVEQWGDKFLHRVWTERELDYCRGRYPELAVRFAAKEATSKALGTGISGINWREIEVVPGEGGRPSLYLHGAARERAESMGIHTWAVSLTHTGSLACAFVVAQAASIQAE